MLISNETTQFSKIVLQYARRSCRNDFSTNLLRILLFGKIYFRFCVMFYVKMQKVFQNITTNKKYLQILSYQKMWYAKIFFNIEMRLNSNEFLHGMEKNKIIRIEEGKNIIIKLNNMKYSLFFITERKKSITLFRYCMKSLCSKPQKSLSKNCIFN